MPQGLAVYDPLGNVVIDTSTIVARVIDTIAIDYLANPTGSRTYSIHPTNALKVVFKGDQGDAISASPEVKVAGTTVSWSYPNPYGLTYQYGGYVIVMVV